VLPQEVTLLLDFRNAFNSVSRQALLQAVASWAPRLPGGLPFRHVDLSVPRAFIVWDALADAPTHLSTRLRQGHPCGPLLFTLALQDLLEKVRDAFPNVCMVAYADDVHLQGPPEAAIKAFRLLVTATAPISLTPPLEADAAFLAAAGAADVAMRPAPPPFWPINLASPAALPSSLGVRRYTARCPASGPRSFGRSLRPSLPRFCCTLSGSTAATSQTSGLQTCWPRLRPFSKAPDSGLAFTSVLADQLPSG
jgi:hypothetical protein